MSADLERALRAELAHLHARASAHFVALGQAAAAQSLAGVQHHAEYLSDLYGRVAGLEKALRMMGLEP